MQKQTTHKGGGTNKNPPNKPYQHHSLSLHAEVGSFLHIGSSIPVGLSRCQRNSAWSPGGGSTKLPFVLLSDCLCQNRGGHDCLCCLCPRAAQVWREGRPDQLRRCLLHRPAPGAQGTYGHGTWGLLLCFPASLVEGKAHFLQWGVSPPESLGFSTS